MNREEFLSVASGYYEEYESLREEGNFYDCEKKFVELWQRLGREYMEKQDHLQNRVCAMYILTSSRVQALGHRVSQR
jgi:hypothetical protein